MDILLLCKDEKITKKYPGKLLKNVPWLPIIIVNEQITYLDEMLPMY